MPSTNKHQMLGIAIPAFLCLLAAAAKPASAVPPDTALFFSHPAVMAAKLSPTGDFLAMATRLDQGRFGVIVVPTSDLSKGVVVAHSDVADTVHLDWVNDMRLIVTSADLRGTRISPKLQGAVFAVNRDGSDLRPLIAGSSFVTESWSYNQFNTGSHIASRLLPSNFQVLGVPHDGSDDIIVGERNFDRVDGQMRSIDPYRLNTRTRSVVRLIDAALPAVPRSWILDSDGRPRVFSAYDKGRRRVYYREADTEQWQLLGDFDAATGEGFEPRFIGYDGVLYVSQTGTQGVSALYRYDVSHKRVRDEPLVHVEGFDFMGWPENDPQAKVVLGFHFDADAQGTAWIDARFKDMQAAVDRALPSTINSISCGNCTTSKFLLVNAQSDREPPRYFLFDAASRRLVQIAESRPGLKARDMGKRSFFHYPARDGLAIPIYVTLPAEKATGPQPTVVLVHGGPWERGSSWEWSAEAQFLASRGYVVLEPEFRGSRGYGFSLFQAGWRQWGLAMQDDLADAAIWAIGKGIADPKRIAIGGASYGGYATLMGLIKNPEIFRCGFEWVGVTDIGLMYSVTWSDISDEALEYGLPMLVGDRDKDADQLRRTSPLENASRLGQPLLMAYGALDRRVPLVHGTRFRDAVADHNGKVEWVEYPNEGHGWFIDADNIDFWNRVEKFLHLHLADAR